ncbi:hypothetical protein L3X38_036919 [Prunus dulcis]|uniref:Uncharacterized protein n=1 Tax=Prunus dulcis TaxID=3755 RepID=A0AAD4YP16_PRUDU|nr:hypothetical protein L3X38_036919 [Prunus dulcis]
MTRSQTNCHTPPWRPQIHITARGCHRGSSAWCPTTLWPQSREFESGTCHYTATKPCTHKHGTISQPYSRSISWPERVDSPTSRPWPPMTAIRPPPLITALSWNNYTSNETLGRMQLGSKKFSPTDPSKGWTNAPASGSRGPSQVEQERAGKEKDRNGLLSKQACHKHPRVIASADRVFIRG